MTASINASTSSGVIVTSDTSGSLALQTASTTAVTIDTSQNVGVGVTPSAWLSSIVATQMGNYGSVYAFKNSGNVYLNNNLYVNSVGNDVYLNTAPAGRYRITDNVHVWYNAPSGTAGGTATLTQAMTLNASGQLLLGTTTAPSNGSTVAVFSAGSSNVGIQLNTGSSGGVFLSNNGGAGARFYNYTGAIGSESYTEVARIDSSGNLGLGVTPSAWSTSTSVRAIQVGPFGTGSFWTYSSYAAFVGCGYYWNGTNRIYLTTGNGVSEYGQNGGIHTWNTAPSGTAGNAISFTQAMTLDASGNLAIGTTSVGYPASQRLTVYQATSATRTVDFTNNHNASGDELVRLNLGANANNTSSYPIIYTCGGTDKLYIYGNGNVVNTNNSYGTLSDIKLKDNIVDASSKLADVMQLKVRNFNLKTEPDHKQIGFIAQEFEQVFPALIDNTTSPNDPDDIIKSIKTSVLVPILTKAIQELSTLITAQSATIQSLTARLTALENK